MKIFLIRHGEKTYTKDDVVLTKKGIAQAKQLANHLITQQIDKVYVSDLTRAKQTFEEYKKLNPDIQFIETEKLREIYRFIIGGPEKMGTRNNRFEEDKKRADDFIENILKVKGKNIAIFFHGNFIRYFLKKIENRTDNLWLLDISNASITLLEDGVFKYINCIEHLQGIDGDTYEYFE